MLPDSYPGPRLQTSPLQRGFGVVLGRGPSGPRLISRWEEIGKVVRGSEQRSKIPAKDIGVECGPGHHQQITDQSVKIVKSLACL
jgi:hypothetical protein